MNGTLLDNRDDKIKRNFFQFWMIALRNKVSTRKIVCSANHFYYFYRVKNVFDILKNNKLQKQKVIFIFKIEKLCIFFKFNYITTMILQRKMATLQTKALMGWKIAASFLKEKRLKRKTAEEFYQITIFRNFFIQTRINAIKQNEESMFF